MSKPKDLSHDKLQRDFVIWALRRYSLRFYSRNEALKLARVDRGRYKCATCEGVFHRKEVNVDHINPVVAIKDGFVGWDVYINNLLPKPEGLQVLCIGCHDIKTNSEKLMRSFYRKQKKLDNENK